MGILHSPKYSKQTAIRLDLHFPRRRFRAKSGFYLVKMHINGFTSQKTAVCDKEKLYFYPVDIIIQYCFKQCISAEIVVFS